MASTGKSKRRVKGKTLDLNSFLANEQDAPSGFAVVNTHYDWGDVMEDAPVDDKFTLDYKKDSRIFLPTAPKAARGPDIDMSRIPTKPPFTAYVGNLPYDVNEEDIIKFFRQLKVRNLFKLIWNLDYLFIITNISYLFSFIIYIMGIMI
ncbi:eukaryotic translation initiation factor 4B-like [Centruroides sculpturatus]|uniref:eukaryotic translation initiation factor 4B-like n=1 Tax=Centruroides sculpturatus TaxID=218467 RepID=UPI000C6E4C52|nr:eukaryotic translation initiation factor 4B-like [Centruroides sculpturatus]